MEKLPQSIKQTILKAQQNEITEHLIYKKLATVLDDEHNKGLLQQISQDEKDHDQFWQKYTQEKMVANHFKAAFYYLIARVLGLTFGVKLMEKGEEEAQEIYKKVVKYIPEAKKILTDEEQHEKDLIHIINEEKLHYIGSVVLGLNDALVELTGALAGLTFALRNTRLIAMTGLVTGIAASLSMAASEYLSTKTEESEQNPLKASIYTGITYVMTVTLLILPYLLLKQLYLALTLSLFTAIIIIFLFTFYISVAKDLSFKKRFWEMASISLGIAIISFGIGLLVRHLFNLEI